MGRKVFLAVLFSQLVSVALILGWYFYTLRSELGSLTQQSAEEALARAEATAAEARARADELARQLRERGQEVYDDARERGKQVMDDMRERGKSAVEAVRSKTMKKSDTETTAG